MYERLPRLPPTRLDPRPRHHRRRRKGLRCGTDIASSAPFNGAEDAIAYEAKLDRVLGVLERCAVSTIAAIAGACTGGGAGIAAACDLRIAAANARFGFPIARTLGNCLSMANVARLAV